MRRFVTPVLAVLVAALCWASRPAHAQAPAPDVRRLTVDDAVRLALKHNLGLQVARIGPQIQDLAIAQYFAAWNPALTSTLTTASTDTPTSSFLSGAIGDKTTERRVGGNVGVRQALRWGGGSYSIGWDNARATTTNLFSNYSPILNSSLSLSFVQPLTRNFSIDSIRQQIEVGRRNRDISDLSLDASIVNTTRSVRHAYWELVYAIEALAVQRQSLDLARESLRNTRSRVEIGTQAPIDIVEAEAEVAQRDEAVIVAEAAIGRGEDTLRALIYDPTMPDFWTIRLEPVDRPPFQPIAVDLDGAVRTAIEERTDVRQSRKTLEANDVSIRYFHNQTLPEINAQVDYGLSGLGGTESIRGPGFPGIVIGTSRRDYGSVLGDIFGNAYPRWTVALNVSYPIGSSQQDANLARARLQQSQARTELRNLELRVATEVRDAARTLQTNQKRVASTRASRELAERRLEAEQKKFAAGQSTSFFVFQAQRDLAQAQSTELRAVLDYHTSLVDFESIQEAPLGGAGGVSAVSAGGTVSSGAATAGSGGSAAAQQRGF
ncbi:MAG: TolC family protein [Acidimicrobiia bacterium]|nr:TolC family protein [Acidimicrobiia bacterium]